MEESTTDQVIVKQMLLGPMMNFVYLIGSKAIGEAAIVDPGFEVDKIIGEAAKDDLRITRIIATHAHMDHVHSLEELRSKTGATVYANRDEVAELQRFTPEVTPLAPDEVMDLGGLGLRFLHTPGHTPGSQCILLGDALISGDTLFVGNIGRCDLPSSDPAALFHSLQSLKLLPDETLVLPGHHYGDRPTSTIGDEKRLNPYMRIPDEETWLRMMGY